LLSKGFYNIANVTNLMVNKKYRLTKEKEESFQIAKEKKQKLASLRLEAPKENNINIINTHQRSLADM
jgi:hypothetical protein